MTQPNKETARTDRPQMVLGKGGGFGRHPIHGGTVVKAKNIRKTLAKLWSFSGPVRPLLIFVMVLTLVSGFIGVMGPFWIGRAIDAMSAGAGLVAMPLLWQIAGILGLIYLTDALMTFLQDWTMSGIAQTLVKGLRKELFSKFHRLPVSFFDTRSNGDLMSRLTNDIDQISSMISQTTTQFMTGIILITGSFAMMIRLSPVLTAVTMIALPLMYLLTRTITKQTKALYKQQQARMGQLNGLIEESITGITVIKAFGQESEMVQEFKTLNDDLCSVGIKVNIIAGYLMPFMNVINNVSFTLIAFCGGYLALNEALTIGVVTSFFSYSRQFTRPLINLSSLYNALQSALAGAERLFDILEEIEEPVDDAQVETLSESMGHVQFKNVNFSYIEDVPVLKHVNFEVQPGATIALVGPTGAGKTTIVNLLSRFYDLNEGQIFIDGKDITAYSRESLRRTFGVVLQDTYLFSGTIKENILYGKPEATDEEMIQAAKIANADGFIKRLPKGYETLLVESGRNLSQGERQLIAIARAILTDHRILVLDEATSNIDTRTEKHIQSALLSLMKGRTSFVIAHRLSTIREADWILVIDKGELVEQGNHDMLMARQGLYYEFNLSMNA